MNLCTRAVHILHTESVNNTIVNHRNTARYAAPAPRVAFECFPFRVDQNPHQTSSTVLSVARCLKYVNWINLLRQVGKKNCTSHTWKTAVPSVVSNILKSPATIEGGGRGVWRNCSETRKQKKCPQGVYHVVSNLSLLWYHSVTTYSQKVKSLKRHLGTLGQNQMGVVSNDLPISKFPLSFHGFKSLYVRPFRSPKTCEPRLGILSNFISILGRTVWSIIPHSLTAINIDTPRFLRTISLHLRPGVIASVVDDLTYSLR